MKNQSGFSLIEVLIALLILSIGVMGAGKLLLESTLSYQRAEFRTAVTTIAWSVVDALSMDEKGISLTQTTQHWQEKLQARFPGSLLTIQQQAVEGRCIYTVTILFVSQNIQSVVLKVAV